MTTATTTQAPRILEVAPSPIAQEVIDRRTGKVEEKPVEVAQGKARKTAKPAKVTTAKPADQPKPATKKKQVHDLAKRPEGVTAAQIVEKLEVSAVAARALIGDVRRMGVKVELGDDGAYRVA